MRVGMSTWARLRICLGMAHGASGGGSGLGGGRANLPPGEPGNEPDNGKNIEGLSHEGGSQESAQRPPLLIRTRTSANFASAAMALTRAAPSVMGIMNLATTRAGLLSRALERLLAIGGDKDAMTFVRERFLQKLHDAEFVVHNQHDGHEGDAV
jgi:hypothetical protein